MLTSERPKKNPQGWPGQYSAAYMNSDLQEMDKSICFENWVLILSNCLHQVLSVVKESCPREDKL